MKNNLKVAATGGQDDEPQKTPRAQGFLRLAQIIKPGHGVPDAPGLIPVSKSTLWVMVRDGRFPKPVKLGPRTTAWRVKDVYDWLDKKAKGDDGDYVPLFR